MLSREELEHLAKIKAWVASVHGTPKHPLLEKISRLLPDMDTRFNQLIGNIEWLIAIVEREGRPRAKDLIRAVEEYSKNKQGDIK